MKVYIVIVRALNWLVIVAISVAAILWYAGTIPADFLPPAEAGQAVDEPPADKPAAGDAADGDGAVAEVIEVEDEPAPPDAGLARTITLREAQQIALAAGVLMLALNLLGIIFRLRGSSRPQYLIFEKEGAGSLRVAVDAIEDTLTKCASGIPEVREVKIEMILDKGGKMPRKSIVHCIFSDAPNLFAVQENVRQLLAARYQEIFPSEDLNFEIIVDRLKGEPARRQRKVHDDDTHHAEDQATEDKPFGPKYPVEH